MTDIIYIFYTIVFAFYSLKLAITQLYILTHIQAQLIRGSRMYSKLKH